MNLEIGCGKEESSGVSWRKRKVEAERLTTPTKSPIAMAMKGRPLLPSEASISTERERAKESARG